MPKNSKIIISDDPVKKMKAEKRRKKEKQLKEKQLKEKRREQAQERKNRKQEILGMFDEKAPRKLKVDSIKVPNFFKIQKAPGVAEKPVHKIEGKDSYNSLHKDFYEIKKIERNIKSFSALSKEMKAMEEKATATLKQLKGIKEGIKDEVAKDLNIEKEEWYRDECTSANVIKQEYQRIKKQLEEAEQSKHEYLEKINNYVEKLNLESILYSLLKLGYENNRELSEMLYQDIPNKDKLDISQPIDSISKRIASINSEEKIRVISNLEEQITLSLQEKLDTNQQTALAFGLPPETQRLILGNYAPQPVEEPPAPAPAPAPQVSKAKQAGSATQNKFYDESSDAIPDFFGK